MGRRLMGRSCAGEVRAFPGFGRRTSSEVTHRSGISEHPARRYA